MALSDQAPLKFVMWIRIKSSHTRLLAVGRGWGCTVTSLHRALKGVIDDVLEG